MSSSPSNAPPSKRSVDLSALLIPVTHTSSGDSSSTINLSSPFIQSTEPTRPFIMFEPTTPDVGRSRSHSFSTVRSPSPQPVGNSISRVLSLPVPSVHSDQLDVSESIYTTSRGRSLSRGDDISGASRSPTPLYTQTHSWWSSRELTPRPWDGSPKIQKPVPPEQSERWLTTRQKVANAAVSVLGVTGDVVHEVLLLSADALAFTPIPGLDVAARGLLEIWDSLQQVDMNRLGCLRLTERCADILLSIRQEIHEAGDDVGEELYHPIAKLVHAFSDVNTVMKKQINRPFIKRYLKRDEITRAIQDCNQSLFDALELFGLSIQIRILRQVQDSENRRQMDTETLIHAVLDSRGLSIPPRGQLMLTDDERESLPLQSRRDSVSSLTALEPDQISAALQALRIRQNQQDNLNDTADLRQLMRTALQTSNDSEMIEVLQVARHEMPEAIKTLQRTLEREMEKEQTGNAEMITQDIPVFSQDNTADITSTRREATDASTSSMWSKTQSSDSSAKARDARDTLDREFLESGIDALRRMSEGVVLSLPAWTITRYEVDRDERIGIGFFSDVYRGTWRDMTVAIKILAPTTPQKLFVHEIQIWKSLTHPNVLELLGASSATGEPPYFFVSPYLMNGSLVTYLKSLPSLDEVNLLRMIYQVAKGMEYLHSKDVLHGDLKAANVLVDDDFRCIISDFGQSEMKTEVWRVSDSPPLHGTLRWQAPELMSGQSKLIPAMDVYAFAISCVEIMTKGNLPWPHMDDDAVRYFVLKENSRPQVPDSRKWSLSFSTLLSNCWHRTPASRPPFSKIVASVAIIGGRFGCQLEDSASSVEPRPVPVHRKSPPMQPKPLPIIPPSMDDPVESSTDGSYETASGSPIQEDVLPSQPLRRVDNPSLRHKEPLFVHSNDSTSSIVVSTPDTLSEYNHIPGAFGYESPPLLDEILTEIRDERRYRLLLQHEFHPSLTLPLWSPSPVPIGAVGYLSKPSGNFVTLFNAFDPPKSSDGLMKGMANLYGYGRVNQGVQRQDKRNTALRGLDAIQGWISSKRDSTNVSRRYSFAIRAEHKTVFLCTESTVYRYIEDLKTPKKWFKANVDDIMKAYGESHGITKEELFLVIGTLNAPDYALFVSHGHPDGQVHFNVFGAPRSGQLWGEFTFDNDMSSSMVGGPHYNEELPPNLFNPGEKVSAVNSTSGKWDTILLARLRFKPDIPEPTSL